MRYVIVLCLVIFSLSLSAQEVTVFASKNPPFNFRHKGKVTGITVDLLERILSETSTQFSSEKIVLDTWSSVFSQAIVTPNALLITASRLPERENMFQWIGPVAEVKLGIVAKKKTNVMITDAHNLKGYNVVSVKNTSAERAFVKQGGDLNRLVRVSTLKQALRMLEYDRTDAVIVTDLPFVYDALQQGLLVDDHEMVLLLKNTSYYIVANKSLPYEFINNLQHRLDAIKQKDTKGKSFYQEVVDKYFQNKTLQIKK